MDADNLGCYQFGVDTPVSWRRFWRRLDAGLKDEFSGDGFLQNTMDFFGFRTPDSPDRLDELLDLRCLVLCGEPGMGKSTTLELHRAQIESNAKGSLYWRSFRDVFNPALLLHDLKTSHEWTDWLEHGREIAVVIDGVDEGLALAINVVAGLEAELRGKPLERLRLILACRDAEWPEAEGQTLMSLWPPVQVGRFQLQRLRAADANMAAQHWGLSELDASAFMEDVQAKAIEAFAARPITLRMLVEEFKENRQLSGTRGEIFRRATLRLLLEEPKRAKRLKSVAGFAFRNDELCPVAKRVAAWMLLGRYNAISSQPPELRPAAHLDFERLSPTDADQRERCKVEAALSSALFCDAGTQARTFAGQPFVEFLAAEYLLDFPLSQVLDLLCIYEGGERFVVPQLAELAAWLALSHSDFLEWLTTHEPEILLRSDASCLPEAQRAKLVEALLIRMAREEVFDDWDLKRFYGSFRHRGLSAQLKRYLRDKTASHIVRRAAIHLADLGKLSESLDDVFAIARDATEVSHLREQAMNAVGRLLPDDRLGELEPFAVGEAGLDPHDELRGVALAALVPRRWKVSQAVSAMNCRQNTQFIGAFRMACDSHMPASIEIADLPALLTALIEIERPFEGHENRIRAVACRGLALAVQHLATPGIKDAFLGLVRTKLSQHQLPFGLDNVEWSEAVSQKAAIRQQLADAFVDATGMTADELRQLEFHRFIPLLMEDCPWVLLQLESSSARQRPLWAMLAARFFSNVKDSPHLEAVLEACENYQELAAEVRWPCSVALDSEEAKHSRMGLEWRTRGEQQPKTKRDPDQVFGSVLAAARTDWRLWPQLSWELQRPEDADSISSASPDPTTKHVWLSSEPNRRDQILEGARQFLMDGQAPTNDDAERRMGLPVFWALWLVREQIQSDEALRAAIKAKWFSMLFTQPFIHVKEEQELTRIGVLLDANQAADVLRRRLEQTRSGNTSLANVLAGFELAWREAFTAVLTNYLRGHSITGWPLRSALEFLARYDAPSTRLWLEEQLVVANPVDLATNLAAALALYPTEFWAKVRTRLATDPALAIACLQTLADLHASSPHRPLEKFSAEKLSELFLMLERSFPSNEPRNGPQNSDQELS